MASYGLLTKPAPPPKVCERVIIKVLCRLFQTFLGLPRGVDSIGANQRLICLTIFLSSARAREGVCYIYDTYMTVVVGVVA